MSKPRLLDAYTKHTETITVKGADYAEVGEWSDGNPSDEDRLCYFVCVSKTESGITMTKATSTGDVRGVTIASPAFAANADVSKYGDDDNLLPQYDYVAFAGFATIIDNGTCTVNERCMPDDNGCAIPSTNTMGYQVIERVDENKVLILVEPGADMLNRIKDDIDELAGVTLTSTLTTGSTTLTITNSAINTDSTIDVYTDDYKISPKNVTVSSGSITLEFKAQSKDVNVKVVVR